MPVSESGSSSGRVARSVSESGDICPVCHDPILMFAIGPCDHPICHRCSTRMRVLCEKNDCPICRAVTPQVAYVYNKQLFSDIKLRNCIPNRKFKIFFEDEEVENSFLELLEFRCRICPKRGSEKTFALLQTHMRREHQLFACDLCVTHLQIFPYERKFYNRKNLAIHRRIGDADDKSYKGHPLCEFCDQRYFDKDELMKHLRKDHYFCHFCDQQGSNAYYDQYPDLMEHFSESHYLCTEGECGSPSTRFTHAFASEIDLKAHKASVHTKNFTKAQTREARTIEVDFQLPPRRQGIGRGGDNYANGGSSHRQRGGDRYNRRRGDYNQEDADLHRALEASRESFTQQSAESRPPVAERVPDPVHDFPSLSGAPAAAASPASVVTVQAAAKSPEEDFPSLSFVRESSSSGKNKGHGKAYSSVMNPTPAPAPVAVRNESRPVPLGFVSSASSRVAPSVPAKREEDYPALGGGKSRSVSTGQGSWLSKTAGGSATASSAASSKTLMISKAPSRPSTTSRAAPFRKTISDENEFPLLGGADRKKPSGMGNPFSDWSTQQSSGSRKPVAVPRSERVEDDSFELPDSYYSSLRDPTESSNITMVERVPEPIVRVTSKPAPASNSTKDFPGLPAREKKVMEPSSEKKKKKNNKKARDKPNGQDRCMPEEPNNASLSEIALGLMHPASKAGFGASHVKPKKATDWFDSPPASLTETTTPQEQREQQRKSLVVVATASQDSSSSKIDDSFPSLHSMSTSVQLQQTRLQQPPGFSTKPTKAVPTPPPGFGAKPSKATDLKTISSALTLAPAPPPGFTPNAAYIEPPEFKKRNGQLITDIRQALETVEDGFSNFRALSGHFRQGMMAASDYYDSIRTLMGADDFGRIFPELLALLPDVAKQKMLWEVHQVVGKGKKGASASSWQCPVCGQVTVTRDREHHRMQCTAGGAESSADDFPTLGGKGSRKEGVSNGGSALVVNGSWIKAK